MHWISLVILLAVTCGGCAYYIPVGDVGGSEPRPLRADERGELIDARWGAKRLVVAPWDLLGSRGAAAPRQKLARTVHEHLVGAGLTPVQAPDMATLWAQELDAAGGRFDVRTGAERSDVVDDCARRVAQRVVAEAGVDVVVFPELLIRKVPVEVRFFQGSIATWDGQKRSVVTEGLAVLTAPPTPAEIRAASLRVLVIDGQGNVMADRRAGIELVDALICSGTSCAVGERRDALESWSDLRVATARAFDQVIRSPLASH